MRQLRAQYALPGIAVSGYTGKAIEVNARRAGYTKLLAKPVKFDVLLSTINEVVKHDACVAPTRRASGSLNCSEF